MRRCSRRGALFGDDRYAYPASVGVVVHDDDWKWDADHDARIHYRWHERDGRGYWRNGTRVTFQTRNGLARDGRNAVLFHLRTALPDVPNPSYSSGMERGSWGERIAGAASRFWNGSGGKTPWFRRVFAVFVFFLIPGPILYLLIFRFLPIPFTPEIIINLVTLNETHYSWAGESVSPYLSQAVIASEDQKFCFHHGFDWEEINHAIKSHERHPKRKLRGASTLSQQTARTLFLVPWRSWVRKGVEAYLTVLMEFFWPKQRILEAYVNTVDFGHGNFGAEAAAQNYFHVPASALNPYQAARLAAILPDPDVWKAVQSGPYVTRRTRTIVGRMGAVRRDGLNWCVR